MYTLNSPMLFCMWGLLSEMIAGLLMFDHQQLHIFIMRIVGLYVTVVRRQKGSALRFIEKRGKKLYIHIRRIISRRRPSGADVVGVQRRKLFRLYGWSPLCSYASIRVGIITHLSFPFSYYLFSCSLRLSSLQPTAIYFSSYFLFFFFS